MSRRSCGDGWPENRSIVQLTDMDRDSSIKYFTLEEANKTLPYVRRIVQDIASEYREWRDRIFRYEVIAANSNAEEGEPDEQVKVREEVDQIAQRISGLIEELTDVGCIFKGFDAGLVDFHSRLDGRDIFFCWKLGEDEIAYWHERAGGFAGRQEVVPQLVNGETD